MKRVTLYSMTKCPHCETVKQYFKANAIKFRLVDVRSPAGQKEFAKTGFRGVPVIKVGDEFLAGFSIQKFSQLYGK